MARTPIHPGEILGDELEEPCLSAAELARLIDVPANRVGQIVAGERDMTADTALRLGRYFGTSLAEPKRPTTWTRPAPRSSRRSSACRPHVVNL